MWLKNAKDCKLIRLTPGQDTVVLGKNAQHSFGSSQREWSCYKHTHWACNAKKNIYTWSIPKESSVKHETSPVGAYLTPSNVTQAAMHKERWREQITQKKKIKPWSRAPKRECHNDSADYRCWILDLDWNGLLISNNQTHMGIVNGWIKILLLGSR